MWSFAAVTIFAVLGSSFPVDRWFPGSATIIELDCEHMDIALEPNRSQITELTLDFLGRRPQSRQIQ